VFSLRSALVGEVLGTFVVVLFGTGAVATAVLSGALQGLWQVAVIWAVGVTVAIYVSAPLSGAHLNPAVTLACAVCRPKAFPRSRILPYWLAQLTGAFFAGLAIWVCFASLLARFEVKEGLSRGAPGSERAAMIFGQYFPNPAIFGTGPDAVELISPIQAAGVEAFGTALLVVTIFALTDARNPRRLAPGLIPPTIGLTVAGLISVFAPLTQAGWNPARDLGPRFVALLAGFGPIALPGPREGFWVYIVGPLIGGVLGGVFYERVMAPLAAANLAKMPALEQPNPADDAKLVTLATGNGRGGG
jgi:glycerol uptake facilitator protein